MLTFGVHLTAPLVCGRKRCAATVHHHNTANSLQEIHVCAATTEVQSARQCVMQVVLLDPMYDAYGPMCRRAGGVPKLVPLDPETWDIRCPCNLCCEDPMRSVQWCVAIQQRMTLLWYCQVWPK